MRVQVERWAKRARRLALRALRAEPPPGRKYPRDFDGPTIELVERVKPFTMTSPERIYALANAVEYVVRAGIAGDFVECGVWRGGSSMTVALTLLDHGIRDRDLYLYDTFAGMSAPSDIDVSLEGVPAREEFQATRTGEDSSDWCYSPLDQVREALFSTGYPRERIHFVQGKVEETIPRIVPERIALLRLDTDWYDSTRHELEHLYPRISGRGVLLIDDYGHWQGARRAVDEYFANSPLLLSRIDYTGRLAVKPAD